MNEASLISLVLLQIERKNRHSIISCPEIKDGLYYLSGHELRRININERGHEKCRQEGCWVGYGSPFIRWLNEDPRAGIITPEFAGRTTVFPAENSVEV